MSNVASDWSISFGIFAAAVAPVACSLSKDDYEFAFRGYAGASGANATRGMGTASSANSAGEDLCPEDPLKTEPGACGCGIPDADTDDAAGCVAIQAALAHRYSFDGRASLAEDSVGGATGAIQNTTLDDSGTLVLSGSGSEQYVDLPNDIISSLTDATFETWLNWSGNGAWERIFDFGSSGTEGAQGVGSSYLFLTPRSGTATPTMRVAFSTQGREAETVLDGRPLAPGTLTQVSVVVDDAADTISMYVDGVLEASGPFDGHLADVVDVNNWIGRSQFAPDPELGAILTEFRIYRAALTREQIALTYESGPDPGFLLTAPDGSGGTGSGGTRGGPATGAGGSGGAPTGAGGSKDAGGAPTRAGGSGGAAGSMPGQGGTSNNAPFNGGMNGGVLSGGATGMSGSGGNAGMSGDAGRDPGLILHYDFDETSGSTVPDRVFPANNAIVRGNATWTSAGKIGRALKLAGGPAESANPQYVEIPAGILDSLEQTTVAAWARWEGGPFWQILFNFGSEVENCFFYTADSGGGALAAIRTTAPAGNVVMLQAPPALPVSEWAHVAVTWNRTAMTVYVNGRLVASTPAAGAPAPRMPPAALATPRNYLGRSQRPEDPYFAGTIDDFRVYNRVLSEAEIVALRDLGG